MTHRATSQLPQRDSSFPFFCLLVWFGLVLFFFQILFCFQREAARAKGGCKGMRDKWDQEV